MTGIIGIGNLIVLLLVIGLVAYLLKLFTRFVVAIEKIANKLDTK